MLSVSPSVRRTEARIGTLRRGVRGEAKRHTALDTVTTAQVPPLARLGGLEGENHYFRRGDERKPLIFRRIARKKGL